jgi:hypothetical protein
VNVPQKYDREKFVLSSEKYNLSLECLNTEKGIKAPGGARLKHWEKAIFRKTTIGEKEVLICLKTECLHIYDWLYDILWNMASSPSYMNISVYYT